MSFGAKYIVLVADHMTGFALWNTTVHNFSIAHTPLQRDVVAEFAASCKKYGVRAGFFYSLHFNWYLGVDGFKVGHPPLGPRSYTQEEYLKIAEAQLDELVGNPDYGDGILEFWFDGGAGPSNATAARALGKHVPRAICHSCLGFSQSPVRWMGNEEGSMPLPSWGAASASGSPFGGDPHGPVFMPPSSDAVLWEHFWFWQPGMPQHALKTTRKLVDNYLTSVGRAANLILNMAPDVTGAVPDADVQAYRAMGQALSCLFGDEIASHDTPVAMNASDGNRMTVAWPSPIGSRNTSVHLYEDMRAGQLIGNYSMECLVAGAATRTGAGAGAGATAPTARVAAESSAWKPCVLTAASDTIMRGLGHKRIFNLGDQGGAVSSLRVTVVSHFAVASSGSSGGGGAMATDQTPTLRAVKVFDWEGKEGCV